MCSENLSKESEFHLYRAGLRSLSSQVRALIFQLDLERGAIKPLLDVADSDFEADQIPLVDISHSWTDSGLVHPEDVRTFQEFFKGDPSGDGTSCTVRIHTPKGGYKWRRLTILKSEEAPQALLTMTGLSFFIDLEKRYFQEEQMRAMLSSDVIAASKVNLTEDRVEYLWGSKVSRQMLDKVQTYEQMFGIGRRTIVMDDDRRRYDEIFSYPRLLQAYDNGTTSLSMEYQYSEVNGTVVWALATATMVRDPDSNDLVYYSFIRNIDERKRTELMLREKAERDGITGLYNKMTTESMIRKTLEQNRGQNGCCAMVMLDIDRFKKLNDDYGHPFGDYVLSEVGRVISNIFGTGAICGRVGGDEFAIYLSAIPSEGWIYQKAQELCGDIQRTGGMQNDCRLTVSIGIAISSPARAAFETLYEQADTALYNAKFSGGNKYVVFQNQTQRVGRTGRNDFCIAKDCLSKTCMLDELEELIFIIDSENYDLLFMNQAAVKRTGLLEYNGRKCYEVLHGFKKPCLFCGQHEPKDQVFQVWENTNTKLNSRFLIKDKTMYWNGRKVRFEMYFDMGDMLLHMRHASIADILLESIGVLLSTEDINAAMYQILKNIGHFYLSDKAFLIECGDEDFIHASIVSWDKENAADSLRTKPFQLDKSPLFRTSARKGTAVHIQELGEIRENYPEEYRKMAEDGVHSLFCIPLRVMDATSGFLGVVNPGGHLQDLTFLESLGYLTSLEISRRKISQHQQYLSRHDLLTGLLNRRSYLDFIKTLNMDAVYSAGIVLVNINGLKECNRRYGNIHGDSILKEVADVLVQLFGENSVYRFAGDEFWVLCLNITNEKFSAKVREANGKLNQVGMFGVSMGHTWAASDIDIERMERHTDELMSIEKRKFYQRTNQDRRSLQKNMMVQLKAAIGERKFQMYLQPKADIRTGRICGAEALVRYQDEEHGLISPARFIPMLEAENLARYVDLFIFEEVARLLSEWDKKQLPLFPISLNFSRSTLLNSDIINEMNSASDKVRLNRNWIEIEITESFGEVELETLRELGAQIVANGYRLSLDDFGSKYSNLAVLSALKLNVLKLDKSIVNDLYSDPSVRIIVGNLIKMCHALGIQCVAEGVETNEQLDILRGFHCDYAQGYLVNKPIPAADFEKKYLSPNVIKTNT